MKKTVFNFTYETNHVEEVIIEPVKILPDSLLESFDKKIACFTNVVPLDELSKKTLDSYGDKKLEKADAEYFDGPKNELIKKANKALGRGFFSPSKVSKPKEDTKVESVTPKTQKFTAHLVDADGKKSKISKESYSHVGLAKSASDFNQGDLFSARQKMTHITDATGKKVWTNPNLKESDNLSEFAMPTTKNPEISKHAEVLAAVHGGAAESAKAKGQIDSAKKLAQKAIKAHAVVKGVKHSIVKNESVKADTNKVDPDLAGDNEFSKDFDAGIKKNEMPGIKKIEPIQKQKADSAKDKTEADALAAHGPNINQEPMHRMAKKDAKMESVTFTYKELLDIFSESELTESTLANAWGIEVFTDGDVHRFLVKDGDDIIAEGVNLAMKSAAKSAYRKCLHLESHVTSKVEQPSRVLNAIKFLNK